MVRTPPDCLSRGLPVLEETLKAVGLFYLVSMLGEIKGVTEWVNMYPVMDWFLLPPSLLSDGRDGGSAPIPPL